MKLVYRLIQAFVLLLFSCALLAEPLTVTAFHYPPYMDETHPRNGLACELTHAAYKAVNHEVSFTFLPLKRSTYKVATGAALAQIGSVWNFDDKYQENIHPVYMFNFDVVGFYNRERFQQINFQTLNDLKQYRIGVIRGSSSSRILKNHGSMQMEEIDTMAQLFNMLFLERIDIVMVVDLSGLTHLRKYKPHQMNQIAMTDFIQKMVGQVVFSKKHPKYKTRTHQLEEGLSRIRDNGTYYDILEKYYGKGSVPERALEQRFNNSTIPLR